MKINTDPNYFTFWFTLYWLGYLTDIGKINTVSDSSEALDNGYDKMTEVWQEYNNSEHSKKDTGYLESLEMFFQEKRNGSAAIPQISAKQAMNFFNDPESLNTLSRDNRIEIFKTIMVDGSDFTKELLDSILSGYNVKNLEVTDMYAPNRLCLNCLVHFNTNAPDSEYQVNDLLDETFCSADCSHKYMFKPEGIQKVVEGYKSTGVIPDLKELIDIIDSEIVDEDHSIVWTQDLAAELFLAIRAEK